MHLLSI